MPIRNLSVRVGSVPGQSIPGGAVTHGSQLTINHVGPWTVQGAAKGSESLVALNTTQLAERISTYPGNGRPSWIPGTDYVLNGDPSNHGGVVPSGGMMIDGWFVPAGTWVAQFYDMSANNIIVEGGPGWIGFMARACRQRNNWSSPGFVNYNALANGGSTWFNYCDAGGLDVVPPNICESIFESQGIGPNDRQYIIRPYLSIATTLAFGRNNGDAFIEPFCEVVPRYFNDDTYHLNGLANSGGQTATLWLRARLNFSPQPGYPTNPYFKSQNDCFQMAADGGAYPGTGTNLDGSTGYVMKDSWVAGADHMLQGGVDKGNTSADVSNVQVSGMQFSTYYFENGGETGIAYKDPTWGVQGNSWDPVTNIWADDYGTGSWDPVTLNTLRQYPNGDGPRAGTSISAPSP